MSPSQLNEIFQWVTLAALLLLTLAVYRQVGLMTVDTRRFHAESFGPEEGDVLEDRYRQLFSEDGAAHPWRLVLFVQQGCTVCDLMIRALPKTLPQLRDAVDSVVIARGEDAYRQRIRRRLRTSAVVDSETVLTEKDVVPAYPFVFLADNQWQVVAKTVGGDLEPLWTRIGRSEVRESSMTGVSLANARSNGDG